MILVDTGYLVALAEPRDALHQRALAWAKHVREPLLLTEYVLVETVNYLSHPLDRPRAHRIASAILGSAAYEMVPASEALLRAGLILHHGRQDKSGR